MAGSIKMLLDGEVGLGLSDPAPLPKRGQSSPNFRPMSIVATRLDGSRCQLVWR